MILQKVGHQISCLGVCYANDPKKGGYTTPAPALDLTTSLRGDLLPSWVYPVEVLHHFLGAKGEQHILAPASSKQQAATGDPKVLAMTPWLKTGIQVAQNNRGANTHHHKQVSCRFEPSSPFYGRFNVQKWLFFGAFQDDRSENSGRSPVCQVGVFNERRSSSIAIGLSKVL